MKNLLKTIIVLILPLTCIISQENNGLQEVGVRLNSQNSYNLFYKNQIGENKYFRMRTVNASFNAFNNGNGDNAYNVNFGIAAGIEKRKELTEEFDMILGGEFLSGLSHRKNGDFSDGSYRLGVGFVLGFNYKFTDHINIGIETIPSLSYNSSYGRTQNPTITNISLSSSNLNLIGMYSF